MVLRAYTINPSQVPIDRLNWAKELNINLGPIQTHANLSNARKAFGLGQLLLDVCCVVDGERNAW